VLGTERHESRRIDDQLVGRAGRQGDAGESQFLISMEDEIMQLFGSEKIIDAMEEYDIPEDEYVSGNNLTENFEKAQDFVESKNLDSRLYLYKYDSVTNFQRRSIYELRDKLLENETEFEKFLEQSLNDVLSNILNLNNPELIAGQLKEVFQAEVSVKELGDFLGINLPKSKAVNEYLNPFYNPQVANGPKQELQEKLSKFLHQELVQIKTNNEVYMASQMLVLQIIDNAWSQQLELMDVLKEEAGLFSYASQDPLIDYILESRNLFQHTQDDIRRLFLKTLFLHLEQQGQLKQ
jgi:preprotein translocase subunit SecA